MHGTRSASWLLTVVLFLLPACAAKRALPRRDAETAPRLLLMSAFEPEMTRLRSQARLARTNVINGRGYYVGELAGREVVLVLSGISMVNAAMTAQTALDHFRIRGIVFSGIAGGVNPELHVGDVVVPEQWAQYQEQLFARETANGWDTRPLGGKLGNFGMMFPQPVAVTRPGVGPDAEETRFWFPASPAMLSVAGEVARSVVLARRTPEGVTLAKAPRVVIGGNGVSGPTFVNNAAYREWVWNTFQAQALDMESAAVAHVAYANQVPFLAFRSLSDLAGGNPEGNEMAAFMQLAADNSAAVVMAFLERWR
jgi:adenosylhomocysteine nucleosidase